VEIVGRVATAAVRRDDSRLQDRGKTRCAVALFYGGVVV